MLTEDQKKAAEMLIQKDFNGMNNETIAQEVNISLRQLYRWKNNEEFIKYQNELAEQCMQGFIPEVYTELRTIMVNGSDNVKLKAIELLLKNRGKLKQEQDIKLEVTQRSNEELESEIDNMLNRVNL